MSTATTDPPRLLQARRRVTQTLFYRVTAEDVTDVVRILHQRMDVDRHL
jgi:plasmid stabilization system protein ParE